MTDDFQVYIFDIDGTLTYYTQELKKEDFLHQNFLFPILRDQIVKHGKLSVREAEDGILQLITRLPYWDYTDVISQYLLPAEETYNLMLNWHLERMGFYEDTVEMVKNLHAQGKELYVASNNPLSGCLMKLQVCGLADPFGSRYFRQIFATNIVRGCKSEPGVWQRVLGRIPIDPAKICVVGDNPVDDGSLPEALGVGKSIIIPRATILRGIDQNKE